MQLTRDRKNGQFKQVKKSQNVDFVWYGMAIAVACIAMVSEIFKVTGPFSGPMLWGLFGIATGRILGKHRSTPEQELTNTKKVSDDSSKVLRMPNAAKHQPNEPTERSP